MGGIKNHLQQFGQPITNNFNNIENPFERHAAYMAQQTNVFCKGCGKQLIDASEDESGQHVNYQAEQARQMCTKCYNQYMEELRLQAQAAKPEPPKEINWEEYIKQHTRE